LAFCRTGNTYDAVSHQMNDCFHFTKMADPYSVFFTKPVHATGHGLGYQDGNICSEVAHITFQFLNPVAAEMFCTFTFKNDLAAFLAEAVSYSLNTIRPAYTFTHVGNDIEWKCCIQNFSKG